MQITRLEIFVIPVNHRGNWLLLELHTDAGIAGIGEASHSGDDVRCAACLRSFVETLRGQDPRRIEALRLELARRVDGLVAATAASALEQACWDILGQSLGVPVHGLLGGALRERIPLYANVNRGNQQRTPESFARRAEAAVAEGFDAVKLAPFDEVHGRLHDGESRLEAAAAGLERVRAVRQAVGDNVLVLVDCHSRFDPATALRVADRLTGLGVFWFEEPVVRYPVVLLREVRSRSPLPIAAGEEFFGVEGFLELLSTRACDVVMPDVKHCGGIAEARRIAALAEACGIDVAPHNPAGPLSTLASVHLCAGLPNLWRLEYQWGEVDWRQDLLHPPEQVRQGRLALPQAPGLGARLNHELLAAHRLPD